MLQIHDFQRFQQFIKVTFETQPEPETLNFISTANFRHALFRNVPVEKVSSTFDHLEEQISRLLNANIYTFYYCSPYGSDASVLSLKIRIYAQFRNVPVEKVSSTFDHLEEQISRLLNGNIYTFIVIL